MSRVIATLFACALLLPALAPTASAGPADVSQPVPMFSDAANAQARTGRLNLNLNKNVTPEDKGAKGDGTTDDTAAIVAARDDALANCYTLAFLHKNYKVTANITIDVGTSTCNLQSDGFKIVTPDGGVDLVGSSITTAPTLTILCTNATPCNNLWIGPGRLTVKGANATGPVFLLGANDLSDSFTMSQIDYVICQQYDATQSTTAAGCKINKVGSSRLRLFSYMVNGNDGTSSSAASGIELVQVTQSDLEIQSNMGGTSANGTALLFSGASIGNSVLAFSGTAGGAAGTCIGITSANAKNNIFLAPYFTQCHTGINATAGAGNLVANGNFVGTVTAIGTDTGLQGGLLYKPQLYGAMFSNSVLLNTNCVGAGINFVSCFDAADNTQQLFVDGTGKVYLGLSSGHNLKISPSAQGNRFDLSLVGMIYRSEPPAYNAAIAQGSGDYYLNVDTSGGAVAVTLHGSPGAGETAFILDKTGNAAANPITITPTAGNIDGGANVLINTNYGWWFGFYDGAKWKTAAQSDLAGSRITSGTVAYARLPAFASSQSTPSNPTGTTDTTGKMMGLAGTITPTASGKILLIISGTIFNPTAIADGAKVQASYGTGTAPTNGAAITGTQCGGRPQYIAATTAQKVPFSVNCVITGLTLSTAYWLDVTLAAITAGTATINDVSISAHEIN
jgi:hypothetical protein